MSRRLLILILVALVLECLGLLGLVIRDSFRDFGSRQTARENAELVQVLMLTDLALWTEARFTRHASQADSFTAFQNSPAAPDQFPAGVWVPRVRLDRNLTAPGPGNE